ncbi:GPP34 family phosphoprotein [Sphaerisporangium sp. TRM90804]|uniref:GOLPH3/VPS74 family protein n=1 Tax=Sphaerisporangium sp. TRM90804 TaxID=3031113 RepID=UPI00244729E0|nr:GPP34 family phosphoprotein [Sphaerisporangium sp. TRM90804]MDH2427180.1 GPP34 family phosphoprotein [Sphaerisporangium sp. TRM90804]
MGRAVMADELLRLALCGAGDGWVVGEDGRPRVPSGLDPGLAGALLAELVIIGALRRDGECLRAVRQGPVGDAVLDAVLARVSRETRPRTATWWAIRLAGDTPHVAGLAGLRRQGGVTEYEQRVRGLLRTRTVRRCFAVENGAEEAIVRRLRAALDGERSDDRTLALLAIAHACRVDRAYFRDLSRRALKTRVREVAGDHWAAKAVAGAINDAEVLYVAANGSL